MQIESLKTKSKNPIFVAQWARFQSESIFEKMAKVGKFDHSKKVSERIPKKVALFPKAS